MPPAHENELLATPVCRCRCGLRLSFGVFDGEQLVGFVIHCIGEEAGRTVAYNTGTGVLPGYRGQRWVTRWSGWPSRSFATPR